MVNYSTKSFIAGAVLATALTVTSLIIGGYLGTSAKKDACAKYGEVTGQQTTFITYGLTESKCFANYNQDWLDINP
jgi:hypothetical protein